MKKSAIIICLLFSIYGFAQVGIGTTNPNAQLDIRASNQATPSNTDGLLIPKVDAFPVTAPGADQDGMLIYVTGSGGVTKGFYSWNFATTTWLPFGGAGAEKIDDLLDGKSDATGSSVFLGVDAGAADDGSDNQNVAVGYQALNSNDIGVYNTATGYQALYNNIGDASSIYQEGSQNVANGYQALYSNILGRHNTAIGYQTLYTNASGLFNTAIGNFALYSNAISDRNTALGYMAGRYAVGSNNLFLGHTAGYNEPGSHKLYIENNNADADNALIYGEFGLDNTTTGNMLRTNSQFQIGNPTATGYAFPKVDGSANQVLSTDGTGQLSFVDGSTVEKIDDLTDGKSDVNGSSVFLGVDAGANDNGTNNINVAVGFNSLQQNTSGHSNTATGYQSLAANTANYNSAFGTYALLLNSTGYSNTSIGMNSLTNNATGFENTALGVNSLRLKTSGDNNTALGNQALYNNVSGSINTSIGDRAGFRNASGSGNVFLGNRAAYNETGSNKLYIENSNADADNALIYGEFDTNLLRVNGRLQLPVVTDASGTPGSGILEIGGNLRIDNNEIITNTGTALYLQNDNNGDFRVDATTLVVDASEDRVGIGTTTPATKLQIVGGTDANLSNGSGNIVNGNESGLNMVMDYDEIMARNNGAGSTLYLQNGNNGDLSVDGATLAVDASANRVGIGTSSPANKLHVLSGQSTIAKIETTSNDQALVSGILFTRPEQEYYLGINNSIFNGPSFALVDNTDGNTQRITVTSSGYVGIGNRYPVAKLHVRGGTDASLTEKASGYFVIGGENDINIVMDNNEIMARNNGAVSPLYLQNDGGDVYVGGEVVHTSDRRLKKDISELSYGLEEILQLSPKAYYWKNREQTYKSIGLIAQEVQPIIKEIVHTKDDKEKSLSISYTELIPVLINAIKEQEAKIKTLEQQLTKNEALEARLTKLEALLESNAKTIKTKEDAVNKP